MPAALASAALIAGASLAVGQALLALCGRRSSWLSGPVGLALLLVLAAVVAGFDGRGGAIAGVLAALAVGALAYLGWMARRGERPLQRGLGPWTAALAAAGLAALFAALPFIASGDVGILGVGLVNDDMASHLLLADWIDERFRPEPVLIDQGYPLGPHALVAGFATLLGASSIDVFAGLVLAIPALTALVAYGALSGLRPVPRVLSSALVALPYLAAAYLAQEAFKEPILALLLIAFALLLPSVRSARGAIPLGVLAAGAVYTYSFPGLAWLVGTVVVWVAVVVWAGWGRRESASEKGGGRRSVPPWDATSWTPLLLAALGTFALLVAPELPRLVDFADFRALDPDRANDGGLGNLGGHISPLEALGVWPTSDFRTSAAAANTPAVLFYAGALLAGTAFLVALPRFARRYGPALPAALVAAAILYVGARAFGTVYTSAKALAIAAPLITVVTLGGLLANRHRPTALLALVVGIVAGLSSFLILRQAPVAPDEHMHELAEIRPLVEGEKLLFLGRDNFVLYELRGSKPFTAVRNFYDPYFVAPNDELRDVFSKFDFDSVTAATLARFRYVLTTRAGYQSGAPPGYRVLAETPSYVLLEKGLSPIGREPGERDASPGRLEGCPPGPPDRVAAFATPPVAASDWSAARVESGTRASIELTLARGRWRLSLQYDATRPLTLRGPSFERRLPANLDYRGSVPFWDAGTIEAEGGPVTIEAEVEEPPLFGRLIGAESVADLGTLAAVRPGEPRQMPAAAGCRSYVDWYVR